MKIYIFQYLRYGTIQRVYGQFWEFSMDLSPCQILTECKNILLSNLMFSVLQQHLLYFEQFHCLLLLGQLAIVCNAKCYIIVFQINWYFACYNTISKFRLTRRFHSFSQKFVNLQNCMFLILLLQSLHTAWMKVLTVWSLFKRIQVCLFY